MDVERYKTFTVLIANLARSIRKLKTEEMAKWNLKSNHLSCLYYLYQRKKLTVKELCDICEEDKANVSRSVEYLEDNGFLKKEQAPNRKYKKHLVLTEKGVETATPLFMRVNDIIESAGTGISEEERETMYRCLRLISKNLQNYNMNTENQKGQ